MSIYLGDKALTSIPLGDVFEKIYLGDELVLDKEPDDQFYAHQTYDINNIAGEFTE